MERKNQNNEGRLALRIFVEYEKLLPDGTFDIPIVTPLYDLGLEGLSFYCPEKMPMKSQVKVTLSISDKKVVSFTGKVEKIRLSEKRGLNYIIDLSVAYIDENVRKEIEIFLKKVDINNILDSFDLENVVDIHFVAGYPPVVKKFHRLEVKKQEIFDEYILRSLLLSILDDRRHEKFMEEKELNFVFTSKKKFRFRVNYHMQQDKVEAVFRVIPEQIRSFSQLGLPSVVEKLLENEKGLILIAGRTGAGKTVTLSAMVEFINNMRTNIIISVEDPIEYIHLNRKSIIKQREIGRDTLSFSNAAKNALRQNPDVLVIGEILDKETMETAIAAAETGSLVLTTIHAGDSAQALDRVTSFFSMESQPNILKRLSLILKGVIAQEIVPRMDEKGLALATEILVVNNPVRRIVRDGNWTQIPSLIEMGKRIGMQSMQDSLNSLYRDNIIRGEYLKGEHI